MKSSKNPLALAVAVVMAVLAAMPLTGLQAKDITISRQQLMDKIRGGWAGQTIGVTLGGPVEFAYRGEMIPENVPLKWEQNTIKDYFDHGMGLFDDLYMDLSFVMTFDRLGVDAPVDSLARAYAYAGYPLWHANQAGRHNIMNGIMPPQSGNWRNNPHADCIDFQIESDHIGLMCPGMPATALQYADKVGHIMNYGDGWYGGVYVSAMYSLAFLSDDIPYIVGEALKAIPKGTGFHDCIADIIKWHRQYPDNWRQTWMACESKYAQYDFCPEGIQRHLNIDAKINAAYCVIGLLYGNGDFGRSMDIATRCGQDADCNPSTVGGILGTAMGYDKIPEKWKAPLRGLEDRSFAYTTSINEACKMSLRAATELIKRNGGAVNGDEFTIRVQKPKTAAYEQSFPGLVPLYVMTYGKSAREVPAVHFNGVGIVVRGYLANNKQDYSYVARMAYTIDGKTTTWEIPTGRSYPTELYWNYEIPEGKHTFEMKWLNPTEGFDVMVSDIIPFAKK